ncbi:MAG: hypothetical protein JWO71_2703 [Candidatus Acidoferrum typicum]|nr:hypothetical protein [Candidatus Acidoferrum typicum]
MKSGDTFLMPAPGISTRTPHLWIVVSDPSAQDTTVIVVSVTTLRGGVDQTVILKKGDHPFIQWESVIFYADARLVDANDLDAKLKAGHVVARDACAKKTLDLVRQGILASDMTPQKVQRFYETIVKRT